MSRAFIANIKHIRLSRDLVEYAVEMGARILCHDLRKENTTYTSFVRLRMKIHKIWVKNDIAQVHKRHRRLAS